MEQFDIIIFNNILNSEITWIIFLVMLKVS